MFRITDNIQKGWHVKAVREGRWTVVYVPPVNRPFDALRLCGEYVADAERIAAGIAAGGNP